MNLTDKLIQKFGGRDQAAKALKIHKETLRLWSIRGIPLERALYVERQSRKTVTADEILLAARRAA
jgi:hypothetical protein